jgi:molybdenum cofactor guanylyltransferase
VPQPTGTAPVDAPRLVSRALVSRAWRASTIGAPTPPQLPERYDAMTCIDRKEDISALILAGGRGRRMGGEDKGLLDVGGRALIEHVLDRVRPQVGAIMISANRNRAFYEGFGLPVLADPLEDYQGPLAGMLAGLDAVQTPFLLVLPCDGPLLNPTLVPRLYQALVESDAEIAVAHDGQRLQPVHVLLRSGLEPSLRAFLAEGQRKIDRWYATHRMVPVDFSDDPEQFGNINTPEDRRRIASTEGGA